MALLLAKHLLAIWQWSLRVQGWDICPPTPTVLNIGQFMTRDEVRGEVDNMLWFEVYSYALQRVGRLYEVGNGSGQRERHEKLQFLP